MEWEPAAIGRDLRIPQVSQLPHREVGAGLKQRRPQHHEEQSRDGQRQHWQ